MTAKKLLSAVTVVLTSSLPGYAHAKWWQKVMVCGTTSAIQQEAWVDVDLGERNQFQLVIANQDIVSHLGRYLGHPDGGVYARGVADAPVYHASRFGGFRDLGVSTYAHGGSRPTVYMYREGKGLRVVVFMEAFQEYCFEQNSYGECVGERMPSRPGRELANWYFADCAEQAVP